MVSDPIRPPPLRARSLQSTVDTPHGSVASTNTRSSFSPASGILTGVSAKPTRARSVAIAWVAAAYVTALVAAYCTWIYCPGGTLERTAAADVVATLVVFAYSRVFRNSSFYDPYWSVKPIVLMTHFWLLPESEGGVFVRQLLITLLATAYGIRLTYNWLRGWTGLDHEDWRYVDLRAKSGKAFFFVDLMGIHMFPTAQVFLGCLPAYLAMRSSAPLGPLDAAAALLTGGAILIQATADNQLRRFVLSKPEPGTIFATGLWAKSRHPNYLGEILLWWGFALFALGTDPRWWALLGAVTITVMFVVVSVPMIDKRSLARRPGYAEHMKKVPTFVPRPW